MTESQLKDYRAVKMEVKQLERLRAALQDAAKKDEDRGWAPKGQRSGTFYELVDLYAHLIEEGRAELQAVEDAINAMPEPCREICRLHYMEGHTLEAITWRVNYSLQSVNRYKKKALAYL